MKRALLTLASCALFGVLMVSPRPTRAEGGVLPRLLGPVAQLAAAWQWVRVRVAIDEGRPSLGYMRAERAFELDPASTGPWSFLASHYAHDRASPDDEPDPALRTSWVRAALALLRRGQATAREPAELALHRALILVHVGDLEGAVPWEGGTLGAWREAEAAFQEALELDPGDARLWIQLVRHRVLRLGSQRFLPRRAQRLDVLRGALASLEQARASCHATGQLSLERGLLLAYVADSPDGPGWPGGRAALYASAVEAFQRAERAGVARAHEAEEAARAALSALGSVQDN